MDTSDPEITFDQQGVCNHCRHFDEVSAKEWFPNASGESRWAAMCETIRTVGRKHDYDCILGLSGGIDSSYLALKAKDWGLRPLVMHVDAGWNSELAVANIEAVVKHCEFDLHTHVVDWEEMRDLHLAYLRAGVSNQDVPQDHVFFSALYQFANRKGIRYILSGGNLATEGIFPTAWHGAAMDAINLKAIHRKFGERPLRTYSTTSFSRYYFWYPFVSGMRALRPLNYMPYDKDAAIQELERTVGWRYYGRKHGESLFTKLFQNYYLPKKFGYDKRLPHLSSLIVSGFLTREAALEKLREPLYAPDELEIDIAYFCKKLRISRSQFDEFLKPPGRAYSDFPNWDGRRRILKVIRAGVERLSGKKISVYS